MVKAGVMMDKKNVIFIYTLFKAMNNQVRKQDKL